MSFARDFGKGSTILALLATLFLTGCGADASADRSAETPVAGVLSVRIVADAGTIEIVGEEGRGMITATGTATATSAGRLDGIDFVLRPDGDELVIEAKAPGTNSRFDIVVALPSSLAVTVETGAGDVTIRDVRSATLGVGAGTIDVDRVAADVVVQSLGAGNVTIRNVSAGVIVENVGAGDIDIADVGAGVSVRQIGAGNITVRRVAGDFIVERVGVGNVTYADVGGTVRVP